MGIIPIRKETFIKTYENLRLLHPQVVNTVIPKIIRPQHLSFICLNNKAFFANSSGHLDAITLRKNVFSFLNFKFMTLE